MSVSTDQRIAAETALNVPLHYPIAVAAEAHVKILHAMDRLPLQSLEFS